MAAVAVAPVEEDPRYEGWRTVAASGTGVFVASLFFFGAPLPPLDPAFAFERDKTAQAPREVL